jgi:hypothetical protein
MQAALVEKYWSLDDTFVRELLNKRLNKSRKDLEDISEDTKINLRKVTRQYDNIKRIYSSFEEAISSSSSSSSAAPTSPQALSIYSFVSSSFKLSHQLAIKYACIIFLIISKFNLTTKRRMAKVSCQNLEICAALIKAFLCADSLKFKQTFYTNLLESPAYPLAGLSALISIIILF